MLNRKRRAYLKKLAQKIDPALIIGKNGLTQEVIDQLEALANKRELVKIRFLDTIPEEPEEMVAKILEALNAEFVQHIGSKFTFYRESDERVIEFDE